MTSVKEIENTTLDQFVEGNKLPERLGWVMSLRLDWSFRMNDTATVAYHKKSQPPRCYIFNVVLHFDNSDLDGTMTVELTSKVIPGVP